MSLAEAKPMQRFSWLVVVIAAACAHKPPPSESQTGGREHNMANCPNALRGANSSLGMTSDGVDVTITSLIPEVVTEIRSLAERHTRLGGPSDAPRHTGFHGGPGSEGYCPIIHTNTVVTFDALPEGAVIHIRAMDSRQIPQVQREVRDRLAAMPNLAENP